MVLALVILVVGIALIPQLPAPARGGSPADNAPRSRTLSTGDPRPDTFDIHTPIERPAVIDNCAICHAEPTPDLLPKERWVAMLNYMSQLSVDYDLGHLLSSDDRWDVTKYYVSNAPMELPVLDRIDQAAPINFAGSALGSVGEPASPAAPPAIAQVSVGDLDGDGAPDVLVCDLTADAITWIVRDEAGVWRERVLAGGLTPVHVEVAELTGDNHADLVVASIGSFEPSEALAGSVSLLINRGDQSFDKRVILREVPRVADVQPADVDGDGDTDFIVAMFGGWKIGSLGWLECRDESSYLLHEIEAINGASHVPVVDLNGDHRPDFIALISQHHEAVVAYVNRGLGVFEPHEIFRAPHPLFGSSSIRLVDLDQDGDIDVLHTNGDALDNDAFPKPYHGLQWHENVGSLQFVTHRVVDFYGAFAVHAADFDGDADLDLVVASNMSLWNDPKQPSLIYLENDGSQRFTPSALATNPIKFGCLEVGDLNGDARPDILTGGLHVMPPFERLGRVTLWTNMMPR